MQAALSALFLDHALQQLVDEGFIAAGEMRSINGLLSGALQQAALGIAAADDPEAARVEYTAGLERIIDGLMHQA